MNICIFCGRTTKDPDVRTIQGANGESKVARFTLAVDMGYGENRKAHFFNMVAFGKNAENIDKLVRQGTKLIIYSEAQQNVWTDNEGKKHYDVQFAVRTWEFAESKRDGSTAPTSEAPSQGANAPAPAPKASGTPEFMYVPDDGDEVIPFA